MAVTLAHEINNPLTGIMGFTQELLSALDADTRPHALAQHVLAAAERIHDIVKKLQELRVAKAVPYYEDTLMLDLDPEAGPVAQERP
ncbi:MAG: hypothetical protein HY718_15695 [Planctomycetes bacterium]|nr:hypothetical protein [Planctomycetota bacterium]